MNDFRGLDAAERRRRAIQESKFLGGDMEHTHLVKGLDYALLQKVSLLLLILQVGHMDLTLDFSLEREKLLRLQSVGALVLFCLLVRARQSRSK